MTSGVQPPNVPSPLLSMFLSTFHSPSFYLLLCLYLWPLLFICSIFLLLLVLSPDKRYRVDQGYAHISDRLLLSLRCLPRAVSVRLAWARSLPACYLGRSLHVVRPLACPLQPSHGLGPWCQVDPWAKPGAHLRRSITNNAATIPRIYRRPGVQSFQNKHSFPSAQPTRLTQLGSTPHFSHASEAPPTADSRTASLHHARYHQMPTPELKCGMVAKNVFEGTQPRSRVSNRGFAKVRRTRQNAAQDPGPHNGTTTHAPPNPPTLARAPARHVALALFFFPCAGHPVTAPRGVDLITNCQTHQIPLALPSQPP